MTRKEEIKQKAYEISQRYFPDSQNIWARQNIEAQLVQSACCEIVKWADKTILEKAEKWLENFLEKTIQKPSINDGYTSDTIDLIEVERRRLIEEVLYDFKKAMEEQV